MSGEALALVRLLQLASPTLPIGAYSYSQGLEWVIANGTVCDATSAERWIGDLLEHVIARGEAAVAWRLLSAAQDAEWTIYGQWNAWLRASRETAELRAETEQMGGSLIKLALDLELLDGSAREALTAFDPITLPGAYALSARGLGIATEPALIGYVWAWLENQIMASMKAVPLGQVAGQRLLHGLGARIPAVISTARSVSDDDVCSFAPGLALASAKHETQYTRLFRS